MIIDQFGDFFYNIARLPIRMCLAATSQGRGNNNHADLIANLQSCDRKKHKEKFDSYALVEVVVLK